MSEIENVPNIRFDFREEWQTKSLNNFCTFSKGSGISKNDLSNTGHPCIRYGELYTTYKEVIRDIYSKTNLEKEDLIFSSKNDIILPCSGETAIDLANASCILKENIAIGSDTTIIKTKENGVFLSYYLNFKKNEIAKFAQGISIMHLYAKDFKNLKIKLPSLKEQEKIASFLSKVDEKIGLLNRNYDCFLDFKKYLLQNLFSCKLQFRNSKGENFPDWEKLNLGEISNIGKGFTPSTSNSSYWGGNLSWLSIADMKQGKYIGEASKKITLEAVKNKNIIKKGTLIMSFKLTIGKLGILNNDMYTNEAICNFEWKKRDIDTEFMFYYLNSINIKKYGSQAAKGITLNNETLKAIPVLLPSIEEQQKIANYLSAVDNKIDLISSQIQAMEEFKKGLLQKMFI